MERQLHRRKLEADYTVAHATESAMTRRPYKRDPLSSYYALRADRENRIRSRGYTSGYRRY